MSADLASVETEVLIVGAGPAGLVLACELARYGVKFHLIEQRREPLIAVRGKGLQPRTLEALEDIGALARVLEGSGPYPNRGIMDGGDLQYERPFFEKREPSDSLPYPNMLMVPQWHTESALRERLVELGGDIHEGNKLVAFSQDENGVTATVEKNDGEYDINARYLVAADGGRSKVRSGLGIEFPGKVMDGPSFIFGDVEMEGLGRDVWYVWPEDQGSVRLCPIPHSETYQMVFPLRPEEDPELDEPTLAALLHDRIRQDHIKLKSAGWLAKSTPNLRIADRYQVDRIFLIGDAAHVHPPWGGQGLNTSIQDAYNLGWKLALVLQGADSSLLETFEKERQPIGKSMLEIVDGLADKKPEEQTRGRFTQQLDLHYRESPLTPSWSNALDSLQAGDRAPDAHFVGEDGQSVRLFDAFQGPHFTVLLFGDAPEPSGFNNIPIRIVKVLSEALQENEFYDIEGDALILVRPDNSIGLIDSSPGNGKLEKWFSQCAGIEF